MNLEQDTTTENEFQVQDAQTSKLTTRPKAPCNKQQRQYRQIVQTMPSNPRIPRPLSLSKLPNIMLPRPPHLHNLRLRPTLQPTASLTIPRRIGARLKSSLEEKWSGSSNADHTVVRTEKHDHTDPQTIASAASMKERENNRNIADDTLSQATTEREGVKFGRRAKRDHPNAPEPVIGMNDEKGEVS